jgi:hypothetical protein
VSDKNYFVRLTPSKEAALTHGVNLLDKWLSGLLISGIATLNSDPHKLNEISTRMVDSGLSGIARKLRIFPEKIKSTSDWTEFVFRDLSELCLFTSTFKKLDQLDEAAKEDLLSYAGVITKKMDTELLPGLQDDWLYLGYTMESEDKLIIKRNWFYGKHTHKIVLYLEFQFNRFAKFKLFSYGMIYHSFVRFYFSKVLQRIKEINPTQPVSSGVNEFKALNLNQLLDDYCNLVVLNPFMRHQCYLLKNTGIAMQSGSWYFTGTDNEAVEIINDEKDIPQLLCYSGIADCYYVCEYFNNCIRVISMVVGNIIVDIKSN